VTIEQICAEKSKPDRGRDARFVVAKLRVTADQSIRCLAQLDQKRDFIRTIALAIALYNNTESPQDKLNNSNPLMERMIPDASQRASAKSVNFKTVIRSELRLLVAILRPKRG